MLMIMQKENEKLYLTPVFNQEQISKGGLNV